MPSLELVAYERVDELAEAVRRDGFAYMPGVLSAEEVDALRREIDRLEPNPRANDRREESIRRGIDPSSGEAPTFHQAVINMLFNRSAYFLQFLDRPPVAEVADAVMGEDCHCISMTGWVTGPGRMDQHFHSDYQPIELPSDVMADPRVEIPVFTATAHYYLDDLDDALGPTNFIPGSHRAGRKPRDDETSWLGVEGQDILCKAGDVVLFRSDVWHRRHGQYQHQNALPPASPLRPANGGAEVPALPGLPFRPGHPGPGHATAAALPGRAPVLELRLSGTSSAVGACAPASLPGASPLPAWRRCTSGAPAGRHGPGPSGQSVP